VRFCAFSRSLEDPRFIQLKRSARIIPAIAILLSFAFFLSGCRSKAPHRLTPEQIHSITRELSAAATAATPRGSGIRTELGVADGSREGADHLDIRIGGTHDGQEERKVLATLLQSFSAVATRHRLIEEDSESREGVLLFYLHAGATTHAIHIHLGAIASSPGVPVIDQKGAARLAIILDDLGADRSAADAIFALPYPLTLSILPNHEHSVDIAEAAHRRGYQVMLHLPMQAVGKETPEARELRPGMSATEVGSLVTPMLQAFPYIAGVNNHQGSQATTDPALMQALMPLLREDRLFYIDSRTTAATVAYDTARASGVRCAFRNVPFLDDLQEESAIRKQLEIAIRDAKKTGEAVAIGHPHPATLKALSEVLPQAAAQGVRLVHASDLVH
jgi:polysaccharide deacetylase 2 family uncharacterized protein YibQ